MSYPNQHDLWMEGISLLWPEFTSVSPPQAKFYYDHYENITKHVDKILIKLIKGE
jgi:hypothetical protein